MKKSGTLMRILVALLTAALLTPLISLSALAETATLTMTKWGEGAEAESVVELVNQFNAEHPDIEVKVQVMKYEDYLSKINTLIAADATPDVFFINEFLTTNWGQKGIGADLRPYYEAAGIDPDERYLSASLFEADDQIWGLSANLATIVMYYNKDLFEQAGIEAPSTDAQEAWSWDQIVDAAMKITTDKNGKHPGEDGFDKQSIAVYGISSPTFWLYLMPLLYSNDASFATADGMGLWLGSPEAVEVMQNLSDLMNELYVAPSLAVSKSLPTQTAMLMNGQLGMYFGGLWDEPTYVGEGYDVGVAPMPMYKKPVTIAWSAAYMMSATSKYPDAAFELFKYFTDPETNPEVLKNQLPNTKSFYSDADRYANWAQMTEHDADMLAALPSIMATSIAPENLTLKNFSQIVDQTISPALDKLWTGSVTAEELAAELEVLTEGMYQGRWDQ